MKRSKTKGSQTQTTKGPGSHATPKNKVVVLNELDPIIDSLEKLLAIGDLDSARNALLGSAEWPSMSTVISIPIADTRRMRAATVISEILFTFGDDVEAQRLMKPYATEESMLLLSSLSARQKIQLAEYYYSLFNGGKAIEIAEQIYRTAETTGRHQDVVECRYYLGRFNLRQNKYLEASSHCMSGTEELLRFEVYGHRAKEEPHTMRWHTGRLLRVRGTALWWQGRLDEATAVLYLSAWLLRESEASTVYIGDALHALGRLLRSLGPGRYNEANEALQKACEYYHSHNLKRARALTDLARTRLNIGLQKQKNNDPETAKSYFEHAERCLRESLDLSRRHTANKAHPSKVWHREELDAQIWSSWLHQQAEPLKNLETAYEEGKKAVELSSEYMPKRPEFVEAQLAFAHSAILLDKREEAGTHLQRAMDAANDLEITKLQFHVYLRLAELACRNHEVQKASTFMGTAKALRYQPDGFLHDLADNVQTEIDRLSRDLDQFLFTLQDLNAYKVPQNRKNKWNRLKIIRACAEKWAIDVAIDHKKSLESAAVFLQISQGTVREVRQRYRSLTEAQKEGDVKS